MRRLKLLKFAVIYVFLCSSVFGQKCLVSNVHFKQDGESILVHYDLDGQKNKAYRLNLLLSDDGGVTFNITPKTLIGDVGEKIRPGKGKEILWLLSNDFPQGLNGDKFVFLVEAELMKKDKSGYYLLGAGVVAAAVYFIVTLPGEDSPKKTGSIKLNISDF